MEKLLKDLITTFSAKQLQGLLKVKEALGSLEERKETLQKELDQVKTRISDTIETISGLISKDVAPPPPQESDSEAEGRRPQEEGRDDIQKGESACEEKGREQENGAAFSGGCRGGGHGGKGSADEPEGARKGYFRREGLQDPE